MAIDGVHAEGSHGEQKINSLFPSFIIRQRIGGGCFIDSSRKLNKRPVEQPLESLFVSMGLT